MSPAGAATADPGTPSRSPRTPGRPRWWIEVAAIAVFYVVYSAVRNLGTGAGAEAEAFANARRIIRIERFVGLYHEETVQDWFLSSEWFIRLCNIFYGSFHFVVTAAALVLLFRRAPERYGLWRNTLAITTGLALIGFAAFPLMPPRLLPPSYGYVDTLAAIGGLWSFDSGAIAKVSNQYAAMPSLHFGWSTWCALVLSSLVQRGWAKVALAAYPAVTFFTIVVTANHFWLDAVGGLVVLVIGYLLASAISARRSR